MGHINFTDKSIKSWISRESKSRLYKVSEFADIIGGSTPSTKNENYWDGEKPWITPKDLSQHDFRYIEKGSRNISEAGLSSIGNKLIPTNSVLLTTRAPVGYLAIASNPVCTNQGFRSLVIKDGFDPLFIYYLLLANIDYLKSNANGSTFQELSGSVLKNLEFRIPSLETQKEIAHILGTLDDKIELNRRMNKTLEDIAQALFKHWFIDFEFPNEEGKPYKSSGGEMVDSELGPIPKGWKVGRIGDISLLKNQIIDPKECPDAKYIGLEHINGNEFTINGYGKASDTISCKRVFNKGDILFGKLRPYFKKIVRAPFLGVCSTDIWVIETSSPSCYSYLFHMLTSQAFVDYASKGAEGTRMPRAKWDYVSSYQIITPDTNTLASFEDCIKAQGHFKHVMDIQNTALSKIRLEAMRSIFNTRESGV